MLTNDLARTPAIALTAYARSEDRSRALVEGFNAHLSKLVRPEELLMTIADLAGRPQTSKLYYPARQRRLFDGLPGSTSNPAESPILPDKVGAITWSRGPWPSA